MYHSATNGTKDLTDIEIGVSCRAATTMPSRKVMARNRTRPSQGSHSLTLVAGFILFSLPVPLNSPAGSFFEDKNSQRAASSERFVARSARFKRPARWSFSDRQVF